MGVFIPNRKFRRHYDRLFKENPLGANVFLLLAELADERGEVRLETSFPEMEIQRLMTARFSDPRAYALSGGPRR
jgi:hypothetical protein